MKFWAVLLLFITLGLRAETYQSPDIVVVSRLDGDWSEVLIGKLRNLLLNFKIVDPFKFKHEGSLLINDSTVGSHLPAASHKLAQSLGNALGLDFIKTSLNVKLHGFSYEVKGFKTDLKATETTATGFMMKTSLSANEVYVDAQKISLAVSIPAQQGHALPVIEINVIKPVIKATGDEVVNLIAKLWIQDHKDFINFRIEDINVDQMTSRLLSSNELILDYERIDVPEVSIKIGNKKIDFSPAKIQKYLRDNHDGLKGFLLAQVVSYLKKGTLEAAYKLVEKYKTQKNYWLPTPFIRSKVSIGQITNFPDNNDLVITANGDFCTIKGYETHQDECIKHKATSTAPTRLTEIMYNESLQNLRATMLDGNFDMMASISEDYLNRLLAATIDAGQWDLPLAQAGISFGPKKMMLRLNEKGEAGMLILDGIYKLSKLERIATGVSQIRFPLVMDVGFRIEKKEGLPVLIVKVHDVDISDKILTYGLPELGFGSSVGNVPRFRGKILQTMRRSLLAFKGNDLFSLPVKELRDMSLESANFHSDGMGRMIGTMKLEDVDQK